MRVIRFLLTTVLLCAALWVGYKIRFIFLPIALAFILAYLLEPTVVFFEKHRFNRTAAIGVIYGGLVLLLAAFIFWAQPKLSMQIEALAKLIPQYNVQLQEVFNKFSLAYERFGLPEQIEELIWQQFEQWEDKALSLIAQWFAGFITLVSHFWDIVLVPVLGFYFLKDKDLLQKQLWQLVPVKNRQEIAIMLREMDRILRGFLSGSLLVGFIVAAMVSGGLFFVGMSFPLLFGVIAGMFNIIPYFGAVIGMAPAIAFALFSSVKMAAAVLIVMVLAQQIESNFITPKIIGDKIGVHPAGVIVALLAGGGLFGIWGMLFAVPMVGVAKVFFAFVVDKIIHL